MQTTLKKKDKIPAFFSVFSNLTTLISVLVLGWILPKFMSVESYSYYKTYTLYAGYLGVFHFGFINGVYLKYGQFDYNDLPQNEFKCYTKLLCF